MAPRFLGSWRKYGFLHFEGNNVQEYWLPNIVNSRTRNKTKINKQLSINNTNTAWRKFMSVLRACLALIQCLLLKSLRANYIMLKNVDQRFWLVLRLCWIIMKSATADRANCKMQNGYTLPTPTFIHQLSRTSIPAGIERLLNDWDTETKELHAARAQVAVTIVSWNFEWPGERENCNKLPGESQGYTRIPVGGMWIDINAAGHFPPAAVALPRWALYKQHLIFHSAHYKCLTAQNELWRRFLHLLLFGGGKIARVWWIVMDFALKGYGWVEFRLFLITLIKPNRSRARFLKTFYKHIIVRSYSLLS